MNITSAYLLDIEGTVSSVSFVFDVMFPYVRRELSNYLRSHWGLAECLQVRELIAQDAGKVSFQAWCQSRDAELVEDQLSMLQSHVTELMDRDAKSTGLKYLQGLIWEAGFHSGELEAELFEDVLPALVSWQAAGKVVQIYSSGSTHAQKLFFGHTRQGNLLPYLSGHYDTTIGSKRESASYTRIVANIGLPANEVFFVSDIVAELDAARHAGLQTALCVRPGNALVADANGHPEIRSFAQLTAFHSMC